MPHGLKHTLGTKTVYEIEWAELLLMGANTQELLRLLDSVHFKDLNSDGSTFERLRIERLKTHVLTRMMYAISLVVDNEVLAEIMEIEFGYLDNPDDEMDELQGGSQW
tara:strand:+ start:866 stop:1189 length:324 start_codon:yes stop_codon:yes gene_type:complete